jgi:hypothetical protein
MSIVVATILSMSVQGLVVIKYGLDSDRANRGGIPIGLVPSERSSYKLKPRNDHT